MPSLTIAPELTLRLIVAVTVVWLLAAASALLLRRASAALRHQVWSLSTAAALILPAVLLALPEWRVGKIELPPPVAVHTVTPATEDDVPTPTPARPAPSPVAAPVEARIETPPVQIAAPFAEEPARPIDWVLWSWLLPALFLTARHVASLVAARRLIRRSTELHDDARLHIAAKLGVARHARLLESSEIVSPVCLGCFRPVVLLPSVWRDWPAAQLQAVLTHELAHVARRDVLWQALARLACALYWFHPLSWVAAWRMRVERELACDDWVLRGGAPSTTYARWLLDVATSLRERTGNVPTSRAAEAAGVAMASMVSRGGFEKRIGAILDPRRRRLPLSRRAAAALAILAAAILGLAGTLSPLAPNRVAADPSAAAETRSDRLAGVVQDEQGRPAADVLVEIGYRGRTYPTRTRPDGRFEQAFPGEKVEYGTLRASTRDGAQQAFLTIGAATKAKEPRLVLRPARQFPVTVVDDKGQPVPGASVLAAADYQSVGEATTDAAGKALLRAPADAPLFYILAIKPEAGADYVAFWRKTEVETFKQKGMTKSDPYRLDPDDAGELKFTLGGAKKVTVRAVNEKQAPVAGVEVYPWLYQMEKKGTDANLGGLSVFKRVTDEHGIAELYMPANNTVPITLWVRKEGYTAPKRSNWDPKAAPAEVEARLVTQLKVAGKVLDEGGKPAAGATVWITGDSREMDDFRTTVKTVADGSFETRVNPEMYYLFSADLGKQVSRPLSMMIIKEPPADPILLKLEPGIRVAGQVTAGEDAAPFKKASVSLILQDDSYYTVPKEKQYFPLTAGTKAITPSIAKHTEADDQGRYEFYVAPGNYQVNAWLGTGENRLYAHFKLFENGRYTRIHYDKTQLNDDNHRRQESLTADPVKGIEINLHSDPAEAPRVLRGRVVQRGRPDIGVPEAILKGHHVVSEDMWVQATADRDGNFSVKRGASDLYLMAETPDHKQRGIVVLKGERETAIPIGPMATARGRLLDHEGKPLADNTIEYGVHVGIPHGTWTVAFGGDVKTDADGRFVLPEALVPGFEYELNVGVGPVNDQGRQSSHQPVGKATAQRVEDLELGDLTLPKPITYAPTTWKDRLSQAFAKAERFDTRLDDAMHTARMCWQNVIVVLGAPDRPACRQFFEQWYDVEQGDVWGAFVEYVPVVVNVAAPAPGAKEWAEKTNVAWPAGGGMTFAILDMEGKLIAQTSDAPLSKDGKLDRAKLIALAKQHAPDKPDARKRLDEALARAKRENKRVLVEESGPYCSWCVKLGNYIEANRSLFDKDFVFVTLDRRFVNGQQVLDQLRTRREGGIPWTCVLSPDGKLLITSDAAAGNIGYPTEPLDRAHWELMLRTGTTRLTDTDVQHLMAPLTAPVPR